MSGNNYITPIKTIRSYCIDICMEGQKTEVRLCPSSGCDLWLYKKGRRPNLADLVERFQYFNDEMVILTEDGIKKIKDTPIKSIRKKCLNCQCWQYSKVRECDDLECPLHPYRMGKKPNCNNEYETNDDLKKGKNG